MVKFLNNIAYYHFMMYLKFDEKVLMVLFFVSLVVLINQLVVPHFVFMGVIFFDGALAFLINVFLIALILVLIFVFSKRGKKSLVLLIVPYVFMFFNSFINLLSSYFFNEDFLAFINKVFGAEAMFMGFVANQSILLLISAFILTLVVILKRSW